MHHNICRRYLTRSVLFLAFAGPALDHLCAG